MTIGNKMQEFHNNDDTVYTGVVIFFVKNFGFAEWNKNGIPQADIFLHFSNVLMEGYKTLKKDQKISFQLGTNHRGQIIAINITPLN